MRLDKLAPVPHTRGHMVRRDTEFGAWLSDRLAAQGLSVRGLARKIAAASYPDGATVRNVETTRRALNKYRLEGKKPGARMREAIAAALGTHEDELPEDGDEEADTVRSLARDPEFAGALLTLLRVTRKVAT